MLAAAMTGEAPCSSRVTMLEEAQDVHNDADRAGAVELETGE
jgi:hypothetical protein